MLLPLAMSDRAKPGPIPLYSPRTPPRCSITYFSSDSQPLSGFNPGSGVLACRRFFASSSGHTSTHARVAHKLPFTNGPTIGVATSCGACRSSESAIKKKLVISPCVRAKENPHPVYRPRNSLPTLPEPDRKGFPTCRRTFSASSGVSITARHVDANMPASGTRHCMPPVPGMSAVSAGTSRMLPIAAPYALNCTLRNTELPTRGGSRPRYSARKPSRRTMLVRLCHALPCA